MVLAARLSQEMGHLKEPEVYRIVELLKCARLPVAAPDLGPERYLELMGHDKKVENGRLRFIVLESIGTAFVAEAPPRALGQVLERVPVHA